MAYLLDTSVAIHLRDSLSMVDRLADLGERPALSAVSRVELENGVYRQAEWMTLRRATLDVLLDRLVTIDFGEAEIAAYRSIVSSIGYSRRKTLDRMIAATALVHGFSLVTTNGDDFSDVPDLDLVVWESEAN